jgi:peroxiredoxin
MKIRFALSIFAGFVLAQAPSLMAQELSGTWMGSVEVNGVEIPFRLELAGDGADVKGSFFNGAEKVTSNSGSFQGGKLVLNFPYLATTLEAAWKDGQLEGKYGREGREYPFKGRPYAAPKAGAGADAVPAIAGVWEVPVTSSKGEKAWWFVVRQSGPEVSAAILRVDGDTGSLEGEYRNGKFVLSHFSGARPALLEVTPQADGTLELLQNGKKKMTAVRSAEARSEGLPEPTDPAQHTSVKDPAEPFHFSAPDLNGKVVSDQDARFRNKVVIVAISGSWCPNCHDEAPFLAELYRKYRSQGLEIVSLSFEEADQLKNPVRLRAFIEKYGIEYPVLLAGETGELHAKLPQAVNLDSWPTTFFLGRDGRVRKVHAGFAAAASGPFHAQMKEEITSLVESLLGENKISRR